MIRWQSHRRTAEAAFTLTELAVAAAVLIMVSALSFPALVSSFEEQKLRQAAIEMQSLLLRGRTLAQRLQGTCQMTIASNATAPASVSVSVSGGVCSTSDLSTHNLRQLSGVRALALSCSTTPCSVEFNALGAINGNPQILYLSIPAINNRSISNAQFCVNVGLTLIRVGSRNGSSGACNYTRS